MSWAQEEWKDGLNQKALIKINDLENQNERLKKEAKQKQFQIESLEAAFSKQKKLVEDEKSEFALLKRENQNLSEMCSKLESKVEKLTHDVRSKESYAINIEGQLQRCKDKLDQFTNKTPKHRKSEQFNQESVSARVAELEAKIAYERSLNQTLQKELVDLKKSSTPSPYMASMPWATDDYRTPAKHRQAVVDLLTGSPLAGGGDALVSLEANRSSPSMQSRNGDVAANEEHSIASHNNFEDLQNSLPSDLKDLKMKLTEKERIIEIKSNELKRHHELVNEAEDKVSACDSKLKQMSEELVCVRHNAEAAKEILNSKLIEQEKLHKQELSRVTDLLSSMEKELDRNKRELNKEIARSNNELDRVRTELDQSIAVRYKTEEEMKKLKQEASHLDHMRMRGVEKIASLESSLKVASNERESFQQRFNSCEYKRLQLEQEVNNLTREKKSSQKQITNYEGKLAFKDNQLLEFQEKAEASSSLKDREIERLRYQLGKCESEKMKAEAVIREVGKEMAELTTNLQVMEGKSVELSQQLERLQDRCGDLSMKNATLVERNQVLSNELQRTRSELSQEKERHRKEVKVNEETRTSLVKKLENTRVSTQEEIASLLEKQKNEVENLVKSTKEQESLLATLKESSREKEERLLSIGDELSSVKEFAEKLKVSNQQFEEETTKLRDQVDDSQKKLDDLQNKLDEALNEHLSFQEKHFALEEKHSAVVENAKEHLIERRSLEGRVQDLEHQVEILKNENGRVTSLQQQLKGLESAKEKDADALDRLGSLEVCLEEAEAEKKILQDDLTRCLDEKENVAKELDVVARALDERIANYNQVVSSKDKDLESLQQSHDALIREHNRLSDATKRSKEVMIELETGKESDKVRIASLELHGEENRAEILHLVSSNEEKSHRCEELRSTVRSLEVECEELRELVSVEAKKSDSATALQESLQEEVEALRRMNSDMKREAERLGLAHQQLQCDCEKISKKTEAQALSHSSSMEAQLSKVDELTNSNKEFQTSISMLEVQLKEVEANNVMLKQEVSSLESRIVVMQEEVKKSEEDHVKAVEVLDALLEQSKHEGIHLASDVESLKLALEEVNSEKDSVSALAESRLKAIEGYEDQVAEMKLEVDRVGNVCVALQVELEATKKMKETLNEKLLLLQGEIETKTAELSEWRIRCEADVCKSNELQSKFEDVCQQLMGGTERGEGMERQLDELQQQVDGKDEEMSIVREELMNNEMILNQKLQTLSNENLLLQENVNKSNEELKSVRDINTTVKLEFSDLNREYEEANLRLQKMVGKLELLQMDNDDKDELINSLNSKTIPELQTSLSQKETEMATMFAALKEADSSLSQSYAELDAFASEKISLLEKLSSLTVEHEHQKDALRSSGAEIKLLKSANDALRDEVIQLEDSLRHRGKLNEELQLNLTSSTDVIEEHTSLTGSLQAVLSKTRENSNEISAQVSKLTKEKIAAEEELKATKSSLETEKACVTSQREKIEELERLLDESRIECEKKMGECEEECEEMHTIMKELRQSLRDSQLQVTNLEVLYERITQDNISLREEKEELAYEVSTASRTLMDLEDKLDNAERKSEEEEDKQREMLSQLQFEQSLLLEGQRKLENELEKLSRELDEKENENMTFAREQLDNKTRLDNLLQINSDYKSQLDDLNNDKLDLSVEVEKLRRQLDELSSEVARWQESAEKLDQLNYNLEERNREQTDAGLLLRQQVDAYKDDLCKAADQHDLLLKDVDQLRQRENQLIRTNEESQTNIAIVKEDLEDTKMKLIKMAQDKDELTRNYFDANSSLASFEIKADDVINELRRQLHDVDEKNKSFKVEMKEKEEEMQALCGEVLLLIVDVGECVSALRTVSGQNEQLKATVEEVVEERQRINGENEDYRVELGRFHEKRRSLEEEKNSCLFEMTLLKKEASLVEEELHKMTCEWKQLQASALDKDKRNNDLCDEIKKTEVEIANAKEIYEKTLESRDSLLEWKKNMEESHGECLDDKLQLEKKLVQLENHHSSVKEELNNQVDSLKLKVSGLSSRISELEEDLSLKNSSISELQIKLKQASEVCDVRAEKIALMEVKNGQLDDELTQSKLSCSSVQDQLLICTKERDKLAEDVLTMRTTHEELVMGLRQELSEMNVKLEAGELSHQRISDQLLVSQKKICSQDELLQEMRLALDQSQESMKSADESYRVRLQHLEEEKLGLSGEIEEMKMMLEREKGLVLELRAQHDAESSLVEDLRSDLQRETEKRKADNDKYDVEVASMAEEWERLKQEIEGLNLTMAMYKKEKIDDKEVIVEEKRRVSELEEENKVLSALLEGSVGNSNQLQQEVNSLTIKLTDYLHDSKVVKEQYQNLSNDKESVVKENKELNLLMCEVENNKKNLEAKLSETVEVYKSSETQRLQLEEELKASSMSLESLEEKIAVTTLKHASEVTSLENKLQTEVDNSSRQKLLHDEDLRLVNEEVSRMKEYKSELEGKLEDVQQESVKRGKMVAVLKNKYKTSHDNITKLKLQYEQLQRSSEATRKEYVEKVEELAKVEKSSSMKDAQLKEINDQLSSLHRDTEVKAEEQSLQINKLQGEVNEMGLHLEEVNVNLTKTQASYQESIRRIETLNNEIIERKKDVETKSNELDQCKDDLEKIKEERTSLLMKKEEQELHIADLTSQLEGIQSELAASLEDRKKLVEDLEVEVSRHRNEESSWRDQEELMKPEIIKSKETIEELEVRVREEEEKVKDCRLLIDELRASERKHIDSIATSEKELQELRHDHNLLIRDKKVEIEHLQSSSSSMEASILQMKEDLAQKQASVDEKDASIETWKEEAERLEESVSSLKTLKEELSCTLSEKDQEMEKLKKEKNHFMDEATSKEDEVTRLRDLVEHVSSDLSNVTSQHENTLNSKQLLQDGHDRTLEELAKVEESSSMKDAQLKEINDQLSSLHRDTELKAEEQSLQINKLQGEVNEMGLHLEEVNVNLTKTQASYQESIRRIETLNNEIIERKKDVETKSNELDQCKDDLEKIKEERTSLLMKKEEQELHIADLTSQLEGIQSELAASLEDRKKLVEDLEVEVSRHRNEESSWRDQEELMKPEIIKSKETIEDLEVRVREEEEKVEDCRLLIEELRASERKHIDSIAASEKELQELRHDHNLLIRDKKVEIEHLQSSSSSMEASILQMKEDLAQKQASVDEKDSSIETWKEEAERLEESVSSLKTLKEELSCTLSEKDQEMENLKKEKDDFMEKYEALNNECQLSNDAHKDLMKKHQALLEQIGAKDKNEEELQEKLNMLEAVLLDTSRTNTQMKEELKSLNDLIQADATKYKKRIDELLSDNEKLLEGFNSLKKSAKAIQKERDEMRRMQEDTLSRVRDLEVREQSLMKEIQELEGSTAKNSKLEDELEELRSSFEVMESTMEQMSMQNGDLEDRLTEAENLLEDTGLAMEDLRLKLDEERRKKAEQQQALVEKEVRSRDEITSLKVDVNVLEEKLAIEVAKHKKAMSELTLSHHQREEELGEYTQTLLNDFQLLNKEVKEMEERKCSLEVEIVELENILKNSNRVHEKQEEKSREKMTEVLRDLDELKLDVASSDAEKLRLQKKVDSLEEELRSSSLQCERFIELGKENKKLKKDCGMLKGRLTLMTTTAKRKEKELHRVLAMVDNGTPNSDPPDELITSDTGTSPPSQPLTIKRSRPKRLSRKSAKLEKMVHDQSGDVGPHGGGKVALDDENSPSSSPGQIEGLPHLVSKGFTNIPHGFNSPFVIRRQQMSHTKQLLTSALDKNQGTPIDASDPLRNMDALKTSVNQPHDVAAEPLQTVTNSPKHLSSPPSPTRQLKLGLSKTPSKKSGEDEVECKVQ